MRTINFRLGGKNGEGLGEDFRLLHSLRTRLFTGVVIGGIEIQEPAS